MSLKALYKIEDFGKVFPKNRVKHEELQYSTLDLDILVATEIF